MDIDERIPMAVSNDNVLNTSFHASSSSCFIDNIVSPSMLRDRGIAVAEDNFYRLKQTGESPEN